MTRVAIVVAVLLLACTSTEKAVVRTVVDIAKAACTDEDTLDACADKILADRRVRAERAAHQRVAP